MKKNITRLLLVLCCTALFSGLEAGVNSRRCTAMKPAETLPGETTRVNSVKGFDLSPLESFMLSI